jgi:hypothetical protein
VYWTNDNNGAGTVMKMPIAGGPAVTLASAQVGQFAMAIDSTSVYWATGSTVARCAIGGCGRTPTTLASGQNGPGAIAVDSTTVYWLNSGDGTVLKVAKP